MKIISACLAAFLFSGCAVTFPIGKNAQYGDISVRYNPPSILNTPSLSK